MPLGRFRALAFGVILAWGSPVLPQSVLLELPPAPSRFADLGGLRVHYKSYGLGRRALVFVHGWSCNMNFWTFQVKAFLGKTRVIVIDLPGHGASDKPVTTYSAELFARAIESVLRGAGVEGAVLVGHSMGTPAIRQFYRRYPQQTLALVAVDGSLKNVVSDPVQFGKIVDRFRGSDYKLALSGAVDSMLSGSASPALRAAVKAEMAATPQNVLVSAMEGMGDARIWAPDPIRVPLLVVIAPSPFWSKDYEAFVKGLAPDLEYKTMEGVDHFLMLEKPDVFNGMLSGFLERHGLLKP
jgi:pimeloyl-ACP methyl ester carboxylesterase